MIDELCPICLDLIYKESHIYQICCGKYIHTKCMYENSLYKGRNNIKDNCILCRAETIYDKKEVMRLANIKSKTSVDALYSLASTYMAEGDYKPAFTYFEKAAVQNHILAIHKLGMCYMYGYGVELSYDNAKYYLQKASDKGIADASYCLACVHIQAKQYDESYSLLKKAAENGHMHAMYDLAECYMHGYGCERSLKMRNELRQAILKKYKEWTEAPKVHNYSCLSMLCADMILCAIRICDIGENYLALVLFWCAEYTNLKSSNKLTHSMIQIYEETRKSVQNVCINCSSHTTIKCSVCKLYYFCSKECQKAKWDTHKIMCKKILLAKNLMHNTRKILPI